MNSLRIILLALLVGLFAINCSKKEETPTPTEEKIDINKLHNGSKKRWYWKKLEGNYDNPAVEGAYHDYTSDGKMYNQASAENILYYWEYSPLKDDIDDTGQIYKKDVKNWLGMYTKEVVGTKTTKLFSVRRYEIVKLTDTRFEIRNILGDGATRVYESTK